MTDDLEPRLFDPGPADDPGPFERDALSADARPTPPTRRPARDLEDMGTRGVNLLAALDPPDAAGIVWGIAGLDEANALLARAHYLGPSRGGRLVVGGWADGELVAAQVWRHPTARGLPADGTVAELSRWCLTPAAGPNAGSRMHKIAVALIRGHLPDVAALVSYSDPSAGHGGALYRACNWRWAPTWHRLRPPPTGLGSWDGSTRQEVKDRWVFPMRRRLPDHVLDAFKLDDVAALRRYRLTDEWQITRRWPALIPWDTYAP